MCIRDSQRPRAREFGVAGSGASCRELSVSRSALGRSRGLVPRPQGEGDGTSPASKANMPADPLKVSRGPRAPVLELQEVLAQLGHALCPWRHSVSSASTDH
eukprot:4685950-Alexandrium_andersonii.AAC.1